MNHLVNIAESQKTVKLFTIKAVGVMFMNTLNARLQSALLIFPRTNIPKLREFPNFQAGFSWIKCYHQGPFILCT